MKLFIVLLKNYIHRLPFSFMLATSTCYFLYATVNRLSYTLIASIALLVFLRSAAYAQAPTWQTLTTPASIGSDNSSVTGTAVDETGNVYVVGTFEGTISLGNITLTSAGLEDIFVAQVNPTNTGFAWVQRIGGVGSDYGTAITAKEGNVYVTGRFSGTALVGNSVRVTSVGEWDGILVKLNTRAGGSVQWAESFGGADDDYVESVAVVGSNIYVVGYFASPSIRIGTLALRNASTNGWRHDAFVAKLSDGGGTCTFTWAQSVAGTGDDLIRSVAVNGNTVYVTGSFSNTVNFGTTTLLGGSLSPFVAKILDSGDSSDFVWAMQAEGILIPNAIAVSGSNIYLAGQFIYSVTLGATSFSSMQGGGYDMFAAKITDAGTTASFTWAVSGGGFLSDYAEEIAVQGAHVYVVGSYGGTASFGSTSLTTSHDALFVTQLMDQGRAGVFTWAQSAGGTSSANTGADRASSVAVTTTRGTGNTAVYVGGIVAPAARFGTLTTPATSAASVGFLASLSETVLTTWPSVLLAGVSVSPNPAHTTARVHLPANLNAALATLILTDLTGRVVRTQALRLNPLETTAELSVVGVAPGMYRVQVQAGNQYATSLLAIK